MRNFDKYSAECRLKIERELNGSLSLVADSPLRNSIEYVFSMGGKRVRPLLTIFAAEAVGRVNDDVLHGAAAIEILHNFTLVHDDIMDNANTRRGKSTVHMLSGVNTAILVGDQMMALAYDCLEKCCEDRLRDALRIFNEGVKQVCDGQALDESLSRSDGATMSKYLDMVSKKTGALLMAAGKLGALLGGGTDEEINLLGEFGLNIGIAFQILDDMLDLEGDTERFGKPLGLDIIEKKKNFLFLKAEQSMDRTKFQVVDNAYTSSQATKEDVISVRDVYRQCGIFDAARKEVADYTACALSKLETIRSSDGKSDLNRLANSLVQRTF